jgi:hypothetical protein
VALRGTAVAAVTLAALAWQPAVGAAEVITAPGSPLSSIYVEKDLGCQVQASGDTSSSFYPGAAPGACGTFLALTEGEDVSIEGSHHLFGSSPPAGVSPEADFTAVVKEPQTLTGHGTVSEPFVVTTHVTADENSPSPSKEVVEVAELTETDIYVTGQDSYETTITVTNLKRPKLAGTLYHAGDCFLANLDTGYGAENVPVAGSVACTIDPNNSPPARFMAFTPIATGGFPVSSAHFQEGYFATVWEHLSGAGTQFPNTVDATTNEDNGMGLSWPISLGAFGSATLKLTTTVSPSSAPTSSSSAGACVANGQVPVTVSAVNGAKAVNYTVDGGATQSVATEAGQATIALSPGQHTLEYWAEDLTGALENPHHVLIVTVASGGPSLTITSDQGKSNYQVGEAGTVTIAAAGPGLTSNPSAAHVPIATTTPGSFSVTRTATDACGTTSASFAYTVIRATLATLPPPVLGETVNVEPVSGEVFVKLPSSGKASLASSLEAAMESLAGSLGAATESLHKGIGFIPLREARQIPVGSTLDTTAGVARIATATATQGKLQSGDFGTGIFKLLQRRQQRGLTELDLVDNHSARQVCATLGKRARTAARHLSSKVLGRINANSHGHFTVRGQYSAATVRGTVWNVGDRCNGTLTQVTRGVVSVRDFRRRKTITLFTGQSYLAKAPHY